MAGAGKKTFTAGEVLTASDVNTYLMEQSVMVFGGTAARSSAIPTPSEGMTTYRTDTQQIESYDGANWIGMSGLQLVKKQTIGTTVSSIAVTDVFSATYNDYLIQIDGQNASGVDAIQMQLRNSGGNLTDANYNFTGIERAALGAIVNRGATAATSFRIGTSASATAGVGYSIMVNVSSPFVSRWTMGYAEASAAEPTNGIIWNEAAWAYNTTTSTTGFNLFQAGGTTFTGGTIYVYGYGT
jgi:hypothetical protein